jgi:iron complex outermembrane receptor protein
MRLKSVILASTSLFIVAGAAPAFAQADPAAGGTDTQAAAVNQVDTSTPDDSAIVVTGIRQSLQSSQNLKRNSDQIVDAIVAQDIGKLPDIAVSDTAARIAGVQVDRSGGEASRVLIRGLPDFNTSYNGREIFTAEQRQVALQDFPSGASGH